MYYPANATEGAHFERSWCVHCIHEKGEDWEDEFGNEITGECDILSRAAVYPVEQWVYRNGKPACLAFKEDPSNPARCLFTKEMFHNG
ncbi:hypothetical protein [Rhizobium leguminosarum]|uniref:hypothetical protein n=1 Tax=Rhizobium leguminosarum TaxID=384 RepID=UPI0015DB3CA1|nr:hypothetical protein [Rhizobium leguminosarum]NZD50509.1 hypothetical protein [Rhizobium leguminosarum]